MDEKPIIGILGGVGPFAGLEALKELLDTAKSMKDQDYPDVILSSLSSRIPDRTRWLLSGEGENPALGLFDSAKRLYHAGVRVLVIACNTAHSERIFCTLLDLVKENLPELELVDIVQTCARYIAETMSFRKVGLLATEGTYASGVYERAFSHYRNLSLIVPDAKNKNRVMKSIYSSEFGIKTFSNPVHEEAISILEDVVTSLVKQGAEAIILGCTELVLALKSSTIPYLNPMEITFKELLKNFQENSDGGPVIGTCIDSID